MSEQAWPAFLDSEVPCTQPGQRGFHAVGGRVEAAWPRGGVAEGAVQSLSLGRSPPACPSFHSRRICSVSPTSDRLHSDPEFTPRPRRLRNRADHPLMEKVPAGSVLSHPVSGDTSMPLPGPQRHRAWRYREAEAFGVESGACTSLPGFWSPPRVPGLLASAQHFSGSSLRQEMGFVLPKPQRSRGASADPLGSPSEPAVAQSPSDSSSSPSCCRAGPGDTVEEGGFPDLSAP